MAKNRAGRRPFLRALLWVTAVLLVAALGALATLDATGHLTGGLFADPAPTPSPTLTHSKPPPPAGSVLAAATSTAQPSSSPLDPALLSDHDLGSDPGAFVVDVATGEVLLDRDASGPRTPASVAKLATAAAALVAVGPRTRLTTRTVAGSRPGEVVLVGAGDTTLTVPAPKPTDYPVRASLELLAGSTAASLRASGTTSVTVAVDDHLFTGPAISPAWQPTYVSSGIVSPVSALSVDAGRLAPRSDRRAKDPALRAGQELARLLRRAGIIVSGTVGRDMAPPAGAVLGAISSPDIASLVESALSTSDNDLAEALARLVAVARHEPATFDGAEAAVTAVLTELGVPTAGLELLDGSGLARGSRVAPETLGRLLALAAGGQQPQLGLLVTALPVAGFTGTLADRFGSKPTRAGAGLVRAKTGTLTGVASLVGIATTGSGTGTRVLAFALLADHVPVGSTLAARDALDRTASALVR